jgi:tRNA dimethylallyltransferase
MPLSILANKFITLSILKTLVVIAGSTATGKTAVAIKLALHFKSEIISADSRQFYRKMDIGTAKPNQNELRKVQHHFIDSLDITENYNIRRFEDDALKKIESLFKVHDTLFLSGGSGLYIDAVCKGIDDFPAALPDKRIELKKLYESEGIEVLQKKLKEIDPEYYSETDLNNPHRLIRAIEVTLSTGQKYSSLRKKTNKKRDFNIKKIGLLVDREILYDRINKRVDEMMKNGLLNEVESLLPYRNENSMQTVGYKELIEYFDKNISLEETIDSIKQNTRNYAKRQMTWFRRDKEINWFDPEEIEEMIEYIEK